MPLDINNINPKVIDAEYAVRGELVIKANDMQQQISQGEILPNNVNKVILCNIGNPQQLSQQPLTFVRQILSLMHYPELLLNEELSKHFPQDVQDRVHTYLSSMTSTGCYTHSQGIPVIRDEVATFINQRDNCPNIVTKDDIFLTDGASSGIKSILQLILHNDHDGALCPIPQYPLYSASLSLLGGKLVGYYLDEDNQWQLTINSLQKAYDEAINNGIAIRCIVIINPGNPTGQCLPKDNICEIIKFCEKYDICILADEVYQENIYSTTPFTSFHKVVIDMKSSVQLASFHSASKGFFGECGQRGGYFQLTNFSQEITAQLYKLASICLCPNTSGQITIGAMVHPPTFGEPSYQQYINEKQTILTSLKNRAQKLVHVLNSLEGVSCQEISGALYAFPRITIPLKAIDAAKKAGKTPDTFYAIELLHSTGICVVPGSGFHQVPGTWHYRTTILPPEHDMEIVCEKIQTFHSSFMEKYRD